MSVTDETSAALVTDDEVAPAADHTVRWIVVAASIVSVCTYWYFASKGMALGYKDSVSHLQIAARTLNSPTSGFAQLGGVWLPLPHLLTLPLVWYTPFYYSGFAGSAVSMISYVIACVYLYRSAFGLTHARVPAIAALAVFALNPNVLYMQSTPMTELLLFASTVAMVFYVQKWIQTEDHLAKYPYLFAAAVAAFVACLTRYEAWTITVVMAAVVAVVAWRQYGRHAVIGVALAFGFIAGAAVTLWMGWNLLIFGNPLNFQNGKYAKPSLWVGDGELAVGHPMIAAKTYWYAMVENLGIAVGLAMIIGAVLLVARRRLDSLPVLSLLAVAPFFVLALVVGQRPLHVMQITGDLYNVRFGLLMVLPAAILAGVLVSLLPARAWGAGVAVAAACTLIPMLPGGPTRIVTVREGSIGAPETAKATSAYLAEHYDGGVILIESFGNESILFDARIPLSRNVYEGSYQKWDPALSNPPGQEIRWIVLRGGNGPDQGFTELSAPGKLDRYDEVFSNDLYVVYKIKD